jgi:hypothetical protein
MSAFVFPAWTNRLRVLVGVAVGGGLAYVVVLAAYGLSPKTLAVGYSPEQPVPYSHALHVGKLGLDCRYCHATVERSANAALPSASICMNCHKTVRPASAALLPVRASAAGDAAVPWVRVHHLPDFVYFDHSAHVRRGVGCVSCHGRIDKMERVAQAEPLSMGWCLECHRNPEPSLRDPKDVTKMVDENVPASVAAAASPPSTRRKVSPPVHCSGCHR